MGQGKQEAGGDETLVLTWMQPKATSGFAAGHWTQGVLATAGVGNCLQAD